MKTITKLSASLLCLAIAQAVSAQTQGPQGADTADQTGLADIVVTATRQSTNLQDTPIAITAVTSEALEERGLKSVADLTTTVPNAYFRRTQGAFGPGVSAFIRGIGQGDTNIGLDPAVSFYVDDVYYPILLGSNFDLLDLDHVEVLRGPQGTLFGRNSLAGAVNIVSKQPRFDEASAYGEVTVGNYNRVDLRAGFNMPLGENVALMVSGVSKKRTGYQKMLDFTCEMTRLGKTSLIGNVPPADSLLQNTPGFTAGDCTIGHLGGEDVRAVRGSIAFKPADNIKLTITGDYTQDNSENAADSTLEIDPARVSAQINTTFNYFGVLYDKRFETGDPFTTYENYNDPITAGTVIGKTANFPASLYYNGQKVNGVSTRGGYRLNPYGDLQNWGVSGKLEVGLTDQIDLTGIVAYRHLHEIHTYAQDGTPILTEMTVNDVTNNYTTAELRLAGKMDWIDWTAGGFYFDADGIQHAKVISPRSSVQRTLYNTFNPVSKAVYANATVHPFGDKLGIVLGARYSDDKRAVSLTNLVDITPNVADIKFAVTPAATKFNWKVGLNYEVSSNILLYASAATGYTPPSYNPRPLQPTQVQQFAGNDDIAYEVGYKVDLFDRRLRVNSALFYTDFKTRPTSIGGQELSLSVTQDGTGPSTLIPLAGGPAGSTNCRAYNAATDGPRNGTTTGVTCIGRTYYQNTPAKVWGFESEVTAEPVEGLLINGSVGYNKVTSPDLYRRAVNRRQANPRWQASGGIQYEIQGAPLGGTITPRLDWSYQSSSTSGSTLQTRWNQSAYSLFNGRITYKMKDEGFSLAVGATNLFDKLYYLNYFVYQDSAGDGQVEAQPGAPRQWYLTLSKSF
ncbi:TonB-dependent receptor [Sphingobium nicotianae]|uniref:TonB-dependent receptor n=1 Tax=Sphingobium nicotianae TaxID=2782607 RepID=A0A9X1AIE4_9SPHN|nr:TonB-dependent receptor [Sphingobium nicotianae]MBT2185936.1 TonB-dependent receptor [Sphingobium nicotianae]